MMCKYLIEYYGDDCLNVIVLKCHSRRRLSETALIGTTLFKRGKKRKEEENNCVFMTFINSYLAVCFTSKYNRFEFSRQNSIGESLGGIRDIRAQLWLAKKLGALGFELASLASF